MDEAVTTIELLLNYLKDLEKYEFLREHDERFESLRGTVSKRASKLKAPLNVISKRLYDIAENTFFIIELFRYKFYFLAKGIVHSLETENPLSLANNTRSLFEQVAVFSYCTSSVETMLGELKGQGSIQKIDEILRKTEVILKRTYSGKGKKLASSKDDEAIHVNTAIEVLAKELLDAVDVYDYLCEFVHPNYGNNLLVSSGELGRGKIKAQDKSAYQTQKIMECSRALVIYLAEKSMYQASLTWRIYHLVEICFQSGAKITNIFSEKKASPSGDGKSQETAFYFKNARTSQEAQKLSYEYLSEIGYDINLINKRIGGVEGEYIYDVWRKQGGDIWFKIPFYKGI